MQHVSRSLHELGKIAREFAASLAPRRQATVLALYGELGAGKTAFAQALGASLGAEAPIKSPTFVLMKSYKLVQGKFKDFVHIDAYRLENSSELLSLGWAELMSRPENLVLVEWADRIEPILPEDAIHIHIEHAGETERKITIEEGPRLAGGQTRSA